MKNRFFLFCAVSVLLATVALAQKPGSAVSKDLGFVADRILLKPAKGVTETQLKALLAGHGASQAGTIKEINVRILKLPAQALDRVLEALSRDAQVEFAEKDFTASAIGTANDPYYTGGQQWYLSKIQAPAAWDLANGDPSQVVAVIDTGANYSHPDLQGKLLSGYDFVNLDSDPSDDNGHGTACSGLIGAVSNNSTGMASVSWNTPIMPLKVLNSSGSGSYSDIAKAVNYAADNGARIINMSLGGSSNSLTLQNAINYAWSKGVVIIAAAGNNGNTTTVYPAACQNVVAVSATTLSDTRASWSSYGSFVDISAPGENILSTYGSGYGNLNGTSFASPITAGVAALVIDVQPTLTNAEVVDILLKNADDLGATGYDISFGYGRLNANRAVLAASSSVPVDTSAPSVTITSPSDGANVSGTTTINANASDNVAITQMEVLIDGVVVAQSNSASISYSWNTLSYLEGSHTIQVRASDSSNLTGSSSVGVNVRNSVVADTVAPTALITSPADGASIATAKSIRINASASDNVAVTQVDLYINGRLTARATGSALSYNWNTMKLARGEYRLQAYAYDAAGNVGSSAVVRVYR